MTRFATPGRGMCYALPSRASDAGPEPSAPPTVSELLDAAVDEIRAAERVHRPEMPSVERKLRREAIESARELLARALEAL